VVYTQSSLKDKYKINRVSRDRVLVSYNYTDSDFSRKSYPLNYKRRHRGDLKLKTSSYNNTYDIRLLFIKKYELI
jgi:hypothetical protein